MSTPYERLMGSLLDKGVQDTERKKARVAAATARKRAAIDPGYETFDPDLYEVVDGDSLRNRRTGEELRAGGEEGTSFDTFETSLQYYQQNPDRANFHRQSYAKLFGKDVEDVSNEDLVDAGMSQKQRLQDKLESLRGQGFRRQGLDKFNRSLVEWDDPSVNEHIKEANAGYFAPSNYLQQARDIADPEKGALEFYRPERSTVRALTGDALTNVGTGALNIANDLVQSASVLTGIGNFKPVQEFFENNKGRVESIKGALASEGQLAREKFDAKEQEFLEPLFNARKAEYRRDNPGSQEWQATLSAGIDEAADRIEYLIENPGRILDATLESLPYMIGVGAAGRAATTKALRTINGRALEQLGKAALKTQNPEKALQAGMRRFMASPATNKALKDVSSRTGVATVALTEGLSTSASVYASVAGMTEAEAQQSEKYQQYRKSGMSHQDAVNKLARGAFTQTLATVVMVAGIASAVTGAGAFEGQLFHRLGEISAGKGKNLLGKAAGIAGSIAGPGARETVEEAIQSGGGEFLSQLAKYEATGKEVGQHVGAATAEGAIVGLASGSGMAGLSQVGKGIVAGARGIKKAGETQLDTANPGNVTVQEEGGPVGGDSTAARGGVQSGKADGTYDARESIDAILELAETARAEGKPAKHLRDELEVHISQYLIDNPNITEEDMEALQERIVQFDTAYRSGIFLQATQLDASQTAEELRADPESMAILSEAARLTNFESEHAELKDALGASSAVHDAVAAAEQATAEGRPFQPAKQGKKTAAQVEEEKMGAGVNSNGLLGLKGHVATITEAIRSGSKQLFLERDLRLKGFLKSQADKVTAYVELRNEIMKDGRTENIAQIEARLSKKHKRKLQWVPFDPKDVENTGTVGFINAQIKELKAMGEVRAALAAEAAHHLDGVNADAVAQEEAEAAELIIEGIDTPTPQSSPATLDSSGNATTEGAQTQPQAESGQPTEEDSGEESKVSGESTPDASPATAGAERSDAPSDGATGGTPGAESTGSSEADQKLDALEADVRERLKKAQDTLAKYQANGTEVQIRATQNLVDMHAERLEEIAWRRYVRSLSESAASELFDRHQDLTKEERKADRARILAENRAAKTETATSPEEDNKPVAWGTPDGRRDIGRLLDLQEAIAYTKDRLGAIAKRNPRADVSALEATLAEHEAEMAQLIADTPGIEQAAKDQRAKEAAAKSEAQRKADQDKSDEINEEFRKNVLNMTEAQLRAVIRHKTQKLETLDSGTKLHKLVDGERIAAETQLEKMTREQSAAPELDPDTTFTIETHEGPEEWTVFEALEHLENYDEIAAAEGGAIEQREIQAENALLKEALENLGMDVDAYLAEVAADAASAAPSASPGALPGGVPVEDSTEEWKQYQEEVKQAEAEMDRKRDPENSEGLLVVGEHRIPEEAVREVEMDATLEGLQTGDETTIESDSNEYHALQEGDLIRVVDTNGETVMWMQVTKYTDLSSIGVEGIVESWSVQARVIPTPRLLDKNQLDLFEQGDEVVLAPPVVSESTNETPATEEQKAQVRQWAESKFREFASRITYAGTSPRDNPETGVLEYGSHDRATGKVTLYMDSLAGQSEEYVTWVIWHELYHAGLHVAFEGEVTNILRSARSNPTVLALAKAIAKNRKEPYRGLEHTEEALVELATAHQVKGGMARLQEKYGVELEEKMSRSLGQHIQDFVQAVRRILSLAGGRPMKDITVRNTVRVMRESVNGLRQEASSPKEEKAAVETPTDPHEDVETDEEVAELIIGDFAGETIEGYDVLGDIPVTEDNRPEGLESSSEDVTGHLDENVPTEEESSPGLLQEPELDEEVLEKLRIAVYELDRIIAEGADLEHHEVRFSGSGMRQAFMKEYVKTENVIQAAQNVRDFIVNTSGQQTAERPTARAETAQEKELLHAVEQVQLGEKISSTIMARLKGSVDFLSDAVVKAFGKYTGVFTDPSTWSGAKLEEARENLKAKFKRMGVPTQIAKSTRATNSEVTTLLGAVPNLFSMLANQATKISFFRMTNATIKEEQGMNETMKFVNAFMRKFEEMHLGLLGDADNKNSIFRQDKRGEQDEAIENRLREYLLQVVLNAEGGINEDIAATMALAAGHWLANDGASTLNNDKETVNSLIGRNENTEISREEWAIYGNGTLESSVITQLGKRVMRELNMSLVSGEDLSPEFRDVLTSSIGVMITSVLADMQRVQITPVDGALRKRHQRDGGVENDNVTNTAAAMKLINIRPSDTQEGGNRYAEHPAIAELRNGMHAAKRLLKTYFSVDVTEKGPHLEVPKVPTRKSKGNTWLPKRQQKNLKHATEATWGQIQSMFDVKDRMPREAFLRIIMGQVSEEVITNETHEDQVDAVHSKNEQNKRAYDDMTDWTRRNGDVDFHFAYRMISSGRLYIDSNTVNPQQNKTHRFMYGVRSWAVDVNTNLDSESAVDRLVIRQLKVAIALGIDMDTDANSIDELVTAVDAYMDTPAARNILEILAQEENYTDEQLADLEAFFAERAADGEGAHMLAAMKAWSDVVHGTGTVSISLPMEVDGKTNGYIAGLLQTPPLGDADQAMIKDMLRAGGIYFNDDQYADFADWAKEEINKDNYEQVTDSTITYANDIIAGVEVKLERPVGKKDEREWLDYLRENLQGMAFVAKSGFVTLDRNFAKNPLMVIAYGAGLRSIRNMLKRKAVDEFHEQIAKAGAGLETKEEVAAAIADVLTRLQLVVTAGKGETVDQNFEANKRAEIYAGLMQMGSIEELIDYRQTAINLNRRGKANADMVALRENFTNGIDALYGHALHAALEDKLGPIMKIREKLNEANYFMNLVFTHNFRGRIRDEEARRTKPGQPKYVLSDDERKKVLNNMIKQGIVPLIRSPLSQDHLDAIETTSMGTVVLKGRKGRAYFKNGRQISHLGYDAKGNPINPGTQDSAQSAITGIDPNMDVGVAAVVNLIHSSDGSVNGNVMGNSQWDILNVHDAAVGNFTEIDAIAEYANKQFWQIHRDWNMADEIFTAFERMLPLVDDSDPRLSANDKLAVKTAMRDHLAKFRKAKPNANPKATVDAWVIGFREAVQENREAREKLFQQITQVNQFAKAGTTYDIPSHDKGVTHPKKASLVEAASTTAQVVSLIRGDETNVWVKKKRQVVADLALTLSKKGAVSKVLSDWFDAKGIGHQPKAADVLDVLFELYRQPFAAGDTGAFVKDAEAFRELASLLRPHLASRGRNVYVKLGDAAQMGTDANGVPYAGKYDDVTDTIWVANNHPDIVGVLLHEMVHAANYKRLVTLSESEVEADQNEFQALLKEARDWQRQALKADEKSPEFSVALSIREAKDDAAAISEYTAWLTTTTNAETTGFFFTKQMRQSLNTLARTMRESDGSQVFYSSHEQTSEELFERTAATDLTHENLQRTFEILKEHENVPVDPEMQAMFDELIEQYLLGGLKSVDGMLYKLAVSKNGARNIGKFLNGPDGSVAFFQATEQNAHSSQVDMSLQEVAIHEILHAIMQAAVNNDQGVRNKTIKLFNRVLSQLTEEYGQDGWKAFLVDAENYSQLDEEQAKERWKHIFENGTDGYHEFIAIGLSNPQFIKILQGLDAKQEGPLVEGGLVKSFINVLSSAITWMKGVFGRSPTNMHAEVEQLMHRIVDINFKAQHRAKKSLDEGVIKGKLDKLNDMAVRKLAGLAYDRLKNWGDSVSLSGPELDEAMADKARVEKLLIAAKSMTGSAAKVDWKEFRDTFESALFMTKKDGHLYQLLTEILPWADRNRSWIDILRKSEVAIDGTRQQTIEHVREGLRSFFDGGVHLTVPMREAITQVFLKTDLSSLLDGELGWDAQRILSILQDPTQIDAHIDALNTEMSKIIGPRMMNMFNKQSRGLASLMVHGEVIEWHQMTNIENIVRQFNLEDKFRVDLGADANTRLIAILDQMTTLRALKTTDPAQVRMAAGIAAHEISRAVDMNGFNGMLGAAESFKTLSKDNLFQGNPTQMWKGYVYEILDEEIQIKAVPLGATNQQRRDNHKAMIDSGWTRIGNGEPMVRDTLDNNPHPMVMYKMKRGIGTFSKSAMSLTAEQKRGAGYFEGMFAAQPENSLRSTAAQTHSMLAATRAGGYAAAEEQLTGRTTALGVKQLPVFDPDGNIVDYRYVMSEKNKKVHMKKRDMFDEVFPRMMASIQDRVNTKSINREIVDLLQEEYLANTGINANPDVRFVEIGAKVQSEEGKLMWNLLPKDTQMAAKDAFGADVMFVRDDVVNLVLGFRKMSLANGEFLGKTAPAVRIADKIWQEIIQWERFRIAVLNPVVVIGNMVSNIAMLLSQGIPPQYIVREAKQAILAMRAYQKDVRVRNELQLEIAAKEKLGQSTRSERARYARLQGNVDNNPVHFMVGEGLFTSIVEEFGADETSTRKKLTTKLVDKFGDTTGSKIAVKVAQEAYMVPGSETAQLALMATQYGDFVGRFVQYNYQMRGVDTSTAAGKTMQTTAIHEALENFIYYNIPQNRILQFMNDYGLMMFTKFFFRIQRVIARMFSRNPVQATMVLGVQSLTDNNSLSENISNYAFLDDATDKFRLTPWESMTNGEWFKPMSLEWLKLLWNGD